MLAKSSTELVRQQNSSLVLTALRRHGPLSHTQLSEATRLSSATVSAITADLERHAVIGKNEQQAATGRGRSRSWRSRSPSPGSPTSGSTCWTASTAR